LSLSNAGLVRIEVVELNIWHEKVANAWEKARQSRESLRLAKAEVSIATGLLKLDASSRKSRSGFCSCATRLLKLA
jgi:hypothetical protein